MKSLQGNTATIKIWVMILVGVLFVIPFVSSASPVLSTVQSGSLEILAPTYEIVKAGVDKDIYWHLFNTTNLLTNTSATCSYHLYEQNKKGEHLVTKNNVPMFTNGRDFEVEVAGGNFTTGRYCHLIECNTTTQTGGIQRCFEVNPTGFEFTIQKSYLYILGLIFLMLLALGITVIINKLPSNDAMDEEGGIIQINQLKHLRNVLWVVVWAICLSIVFIISNISLAHLDSLLLGNLFFTLYKIMFYVTIIGVPVYFVWIFYKIFRDKEMQNLINRGVDIKGTP